MKFLFILLCAAVAASAAELKTTETGIEIAAGSLGSFTMTYPEFEPVSKVIGVKATGADAVVSYESGAACAVAIAGEEVSLAFSGVPAAVKSWKMTMLIDIGFSKGGAWKIADREGTFLLV